MPSVSRPSRLLRGHAVAGRLTLEEFAQRVDTVYAARTRGELEALTGTFPQTRGR